MDIKFYQLAKKDQQLNEGIFVHLLLEAFYMGYEFEQYYVSRELKPFHPYLMKFIGQSSQGIYYILFGKFMLLLAIFLENLLYGLALLKSINNF